MKILHVMGRMNLGGTERQLAGMLKVVRDESLWDATLCVLRPGSTYVRELREFGVRVIELPQRQDKDPRRVYDFLRLVEHVDPSVIHSSLWGASAFVRFALVGARDRRVVVSERRVETFRRLPARIIDRLPFARPDLFIGNSSDVCEFIANEYRIPGDRVRRVHNGLDNAIFYPSQSWTGVSEGPQLRIGCVGRLIPMKGFNTVIEALRILGVESGASLRIAGDGPDRGELERVAQGLNVSFLGPLSAPELVADFLRSCDVLVHVSRAEGLPNVVLEARACGVPVIVSDAPGMSESAPGSTPIRPGDPVALAELLAKFLSDDIESHPPASFPTFSDVAKEHLDIFKEAVGRGPERGRR